MANRTTISVSVPALSDIETALRIYYTRTQLNSSDIRKLFGKIGNNRVVKLKNIVRARMREKGIPCLSATLVHTQTAFEAWGINISALERNYEKLLALEKKE